MDKKIFLYLVSSGLELMTLTQRNIFLSVPTTDNFPEWKLIAFRDKLAFRDIVNMSLQEQFIRK
jgi:hypothetical protein